MGKTYVVIAHTGKHADSTQKVIYAGGDFIIATAQKVDGINHTLNLETWMCDTLIKEHELTTRNSWIEIYNKMEELEKSIELKREELLREEQLLKLIVSE